MNTKQVITCPRPEELSRALNEGLEPVLEEHISHCETCLSQWEEEQNLLSLCTGLPWKEPSTEQIEDVRTSLIANAVVSQLKKPVRKKQMTVIWALAAAAVLVLVSAAWLRLPDTQSSEVSDNKLQAVIFENEDARFVRLGDEKDEVVRLTEGAITVEVNQLKPGERFRVVTGDSEVEVKGTLFEVVAEKDQLRSVRVLKGEVEVRKPGKPEIILAPGTHWEANNEDKVTQLLTSEKTTPTVAVIPSDSPQIPRSIPAPIQQVEIVPIPLREKTKSELLFEKGFAALEKRNYSLAIESFGNALSEGSLGPLAEDNQYFYAVALRRAGRTLEAQKAFRTFLSRYPKSHRAGEASVALGWLRLNAKDLDEAEKLFEMASKDLSSEVRAHAKEGLSAIKKQTKRPKSIVIESPQKPQFEVPSNLELKSSSSPVFPPSLPTFP